MDKKARISLQGLGYDNYFIDNAAAGSEEGFSPARVIAEHKETYIVKNEYGEFTAKITGKMIYSGETRLDYPSVGDWVMISMLDSHDASIHSILPRRTVIKRKTPGKLSFRKRLPKNS